MSYLYMFKLYWQYAIGSRWKIVAIYALYITGDIIWVIIPLVFAQILNSIQTSSSEMILENVTYWTVVWFLVTLGVSTIPRIARIIRESLAFRVKQSFINKHYKITTELPMEWHTDHHSGDTINRINIAAESLYQFALNQYVYIGIFVKIVGPVVAMYYLNVGKIIFSIIVCFVLISLVVARYFDKKMIVQFRKLNEINHKISATFYDFVSNIRTVITLHLGEKTRKDLNEKIELGYKTTMYVRATLDNIKFTTLFMLVELPRIGIIFYYIMLQLRVSGTVLVGNVSALFQYLNQISDTFLKLVREAQNLLRYRTDLEAVYPITHAKLAINCELKIKKNWKNIKVNDLHFAYGDGKEIVKGVSFKIKKGEKIAIIGESGSGKSTLMSLIRGLYVAGNGDIKIDAAKKTYDFGCLAKITTLMPQDPEIFENTIEYNITMGLDYPKKLVEKVISLSCFDKVLNKLPNGLQTDIREKGVNLSGGERQRLALARNLLAAQDTDIVLMDEPTSSVDMKNEQLIYQNIFEFCKDKTIISSVHKLYLLKMFDRVLKMEKGLMSQTEYSVAE